MLSLRELQEDFARSLDAAPTAQGEAPVEISAALSSAVRGDELSAAQRVQVYRNNYQTSLRGALRAVYPVVAQLVGEGFFAWLGYEFLLRYPSRSGTLHDFGIELAGFIESFEAAKPHPFLPDVARLEWAWHEAFHEQEQPPLDLSRLAAVEPYQHEALQFRLHPSTRLLKFSTPALSIWRAHQPDSDVTPVGAAGAQECAVVIRAHADVAVAELGFGEFQLLTALQSGVTFGDACEEAHAVDPELDFAGCIERHVALGTLADFCI